MYLASRLPNLYRGCSWTLSLGPTSLYKNSRKCLYVIKYHDYLHTEIYIYIYCIQKSYTFHHRSKFHQFTENHSCNIRQQHPNIRNSRKQLVASKFSSKINILAQREYIMVVQYLVFLMTGPPINIGHENFNSCMYTCSGARCIFTKHEYTCTSVWKPEWWNCLE